jgi:CubicO group peptidase (beta-lactamase class C family)
VIIKSAYSLPLQFKTGEKYQYCNLSYFMLAEIISQVSKMPWQDYIRINLFLPAGMKNTGMTDFYPIIPHRASGYMHKGDTLVNADAMYAVRPSGGFLSTSSDMILWEKALLEKKIILKKENWDMLWKPVIKVSDKPESKLYYAFGWFVDEYNGHKIIMHGGANTGFRSHYDRFVDDRLSLIVLTNTDEAVPAKITRALADYYFRSKRTW